MLAQLNYQVGATSLTGFEPPQGKNRLNSQNGNAAVEEGIDLGVGNPARHSAEA